MYKYLHVKYPLFLSDVSQTLIFSADFRNTLKYENFINIRPVGAESWYADRFNEANSRFSQSCERAWKETLTHQDDLIGDWLFRDSYENVV